MNVEGSVYMLWRECVSQQKQGGKHFISSAPYSFFRQVASLAKLDLNEIVLGNGKGKFYDIELFDKKVLQDLSKDKIARLKKFRYKMKFLNSEEDDADKTILKKIKLQLEKMKVLIWIILIISVVLIADFVVVFLMTRTCLV
jgi:hypothetical protein